MWKFQNIICLALNPNLFSKLKSKYFTERNYGISSFCKKNLKYLTDKNCLTCTSPPSDVSTKLSIFLALHNYGGKIVLVAGHS